MPKQISIHHAGNTVAPVFATLESLGLRVWHEPGAGDGKIYCAENDRFSVSAYDPIALLGLIRMLEVRGENWMPTATEAERYLKFEELPSNKSLDRP
jgi:hypothetical protein